VKIAKGVGWESESELGLDLPARLILLLRSVFVQFDVRTASVPPHLSLQLPRRR